MEDKEKEELISSDDEKSTSSKLIAFIIIACFIFSIALVIIAIIVYLSKDKSLSELEVYKKYEKQEKIKLGDDRIVYKAKNKETNETVAIKEIKLKTTDIRNKVEKDIKFMNASNHLSNETFQLIEVFEQRSTKFLVTEYYDEDLSITLSKTEKGFEIGLVKRLVNIMNKNLQGLRGFNVVYNNIKLENIIVQMAGDKIGMIKLTDFSEAELFTNDKNDTKENEWGITPVLGDINEEKGDLYNIGKEIYRMLFKKTDKKNEEMIKDIKEKFNNTELSDLMGKLLVEDAKERISWDDYFNHTFFAQKISKNN
jgi:serine/threonine protein kinase